MNFKAISVTFVSESKDMIKISNDVKVFLQYKSLIW